MLDVVRAKNHVGVAQTANGGDVRGHEQRFQEHHVEHRFPKDGLDALLHFRDVEPAQVVALSRDKMARRVTDVELCVCMNGLKPGGFQVGSIHGFGTEGMFVGAQTQDLEVMSFLNQRLGDAVHRQASAIHARSRRLVTQLKDAQFVHGRSQR